MAKLASITEDKSKMSIDRLYLIHTMELAKMGLNMNIFPTLKELWENADEREKKKKNVKWRGEGHVTLIYVLGYHKCGGIKSIVSLKYSNNIMA